MVQSWVLHVGHYHTAFNGTTVRCGRANLLHDEIPHSSEPKTVRSYLMPYIGRGSELLQYGPSLRLFSAVYECYMRMF